MSKSCFNAVMLFVAIMLLGFNVTSAKADILIVAANTPQLGDQSVVFTGSTGNPVFGTTSATNVQVRFEGNETLVTSPNQVGADVGNFSSLMVSIPGRTFTSLVLNIDALVTTGQTRFVNFTVTEPNGQTTTNSFALAGSTSDNFFTITAINNQQILSVALFATNTLNGTAQFQAIEDVSGIRIGGIQVTPTAVPEPATMILLGTGLAGVAAKVRRRRRNS